MEVPLEKSTSTAAPVDGFYHRNSDSFYVPEAEKGFLGDYSKANISTLSTECDIPESEKAFLADNQSPKQDDVIEIGSSSDEQESSKGDNSDTSDFRLLEKSESDEDELNISYERNIHVEENSRSLVDSDDRTTDDSIGDVENHNEPRQVVIEYVEELNNYNQIEVNADSNSVDWENNEQQSSDDNGEHSDDGILVAEEQQLDNYIEENKSDDVIELELRQPAQQNEIEIILQEEASEINQNELVLSSEIMPSEVNIDINKPEENIEEKGLAQKKESMEYKSGNQTIQNTSEEISSENIVQSEEKLYNPQSDSKLTVASNEKTTNEQSSNTTVILQKDNTIRKNEEIDTEIINSNETEETMGSKEIIKVDQSTNTTVLTPEEYREKSDDSDIEIDKVKIRKTYHPKHGTTKVVTEDQTMSSASSDTTEGEVVKHEIVVKVDVHTPTKRKTEESVNKRVTRRSSAVLSQSAKSDILGNMTNPEMLLAISDYDIMDEDQQNTIFTPRKKAYVTDILQDSTLGRTLDSDGGCTPGKYIQNVTKKFLLDFSTH